VVRQAFGVYGFWWPGRYLGFRVVGHVARQALPDHAHLPTLRAIRKDIPVVASPAAAEVARDMGFEDVTSLDHGESTDIAGGKLTITGTAGAICGRVYLAFAAAGRRSFDSCSGRSGDHGWTDTLPGGQSPANVSRCSAHTDCAIFNQL
jgi:hypothetical protein